MRPGPHAGVPEVSVIVPALDEAAVLSDMVASLEAQVDPPSFEVILVDGGSRDGTVERFRARTAGWAGPVRRARLLVGAGRGRAVQMNAGAAAAEAGIVLFLHADTSLPPRGLRAVVEALRDRRVAGGGFSLRFRERGALLRLIAGYASLRSRLRRIHYGDQAIFARRSVFEGVGGYPGVPLFEDLALARALRKAGCIRALPLAVETSARRLLRGGVARTAGRFAWLKLRRAFGEGPWRLKRSYPDVR